MRPMQLCRWLFAVGACSCTAREAPACITATHPGTSATALIKIDATGHVAITLRHDALAFALNETPQRIGDAPMYELIDGPDEALTHCFADARDRFATLFDLSADGRRVEVEIVASPTTAEVRAWQREHPDRRLPVRLDFVARAELPAPARSLTARFPDVLGTVIVTFDRPGEEPLTLPMRAGETTPPIEVHPRAAPDAAQSPRSTGANGDGAIAPGELAAPMSTLEVAWRYVGMGFTHIVPRGLDHVLFVLGLFFLGASTRALLIQVTAFTVAHSITLALSMLDVVGLPPSVVEPTIAASITLIAIENLATARVHAWRPLVVFVFGLVHGLGFAGVLRELGMPRSQMAAALVSFNVGVEIGQLTVIAGALLAVGWWRKRAWYRRRVAVPASLAIAALGALWTVQRLF